MFQVVLCDGHSFERRHIERWLEHNITSPVTGAVLASRTRFPNHALRNAIEEYFKTLAASHRCAIRSVTSSQGDATFQSYREGQEGQQVFPLQRCVNALMEMSLTANADLPAEVALKRIVDEARDLIGAEVASVFLVDTANQALFSTVNSTGGEIRIPLTFGIAGLVATSGEPVIIADAYSDSRFNSAVDKRTGFKTRNILCCPIKNKKGVVVGVAQLINKGRNGALSPIVAESTAEIIANGEEPSVIQATPFTSEDQRFLMVFASQAAAAIASNGGTFAEDPKEEAASKCRTAAAENASKSAEKAMAKKKSASGRQSSPLRPVPSEPKPSVAPTMEKALNDCLEKCFGG